MLRVKRTILFSLFGVLIILATAFAMNQYQAANSTGIIIQSNTSVIMAKVDLGNTMSASTFSATGYGSITVAEADGLNITRFSVTPWDTSYWNERFYTYSINVTIDGDSWTIPLMVSGDLQNSLALGWSNGYYTPWNIYHISQGYHATSFTVYGKTQVSSTDLNVDNSFYFDLSV